MTSTTLAFAGPDFTSALTAVRFGSASIPSCQRSEACYSTLPTIR